MTVKVTVELPEELANRARAVAARAQRPFEDLLIEWIDRAAAEPAVDALPDHELLALCAGEMESAQQQELSQLLAAQRDGPLPATERDRLEVLMRSYRRGLVRKAQALQVAVQRGLRPPLA
jgi:hypothetical protein